MLLLEIALRGDAGGGGVCCRDAVVGLRPLERLRGSFAIDLAWKNVIGPLWAD